MVIWWSSHSYTMYYIILNSIILYALYYIMLYYITYYIILYSLREKCPNTEYFLVRIFPYSDWIQSECRKIRTRKNSVFGHFSRSDYIILYYYIILHYIILYYVLYYMYYIICIILYIMLSYVLIKCIWLFLVVRYDYTMDNLVQNFISNGLL